MRSSSALAVVLLLSCGCGEDAPPLDELPLRDALRARPEVIAALPGPARLRLLERLEEARVNDRDTDSLVAGAPQEMVAALDEARVRRSAGPLVVGVVGASGEVRPLAGAKGDEPLPPLTGDPATPAEARALEGRAGAILRGLVHAAGSHALVRVVGWPAGAVAIGDVVFANAAWLAALAGDADVDGGAPPAPPPAAPPATTPPPPATAPPPAMPPRWPPDAGAYYPSPLPVWPPPPPPYEPPPPPPDTTCEDACSAGAYGLGAADSCANSDYQDDSCQSSNEDDSCQSSNQDDSCGGSSGEGTDSCGGSSGTETSSSNCQVGRRGRRHDPGTLAVLFLPLGYLLRQRRR